MFTVIFLGIVSMVMICDGSGSCVFHTYGRLVTCSNNYFPGDGCVLHMFSYVCQCAMTCWIFILATL